MVLNILMLMTVCQFITVQSVCDRDNGPSGVIDCYQSGSNYSNMYQWRSCLTDSYIQTKTNSRWKCDNRSSTYCYFRCMAEFHNSNSSFVTDDCACKSGTYISENNLTLPGHCYSPSDTNCKWYNDCLEQTFKCNEANEDEEYGINYATKFCNLYKNHNQTFSSTGQKWIAAVRKCHQVTLVPLLRPWRTHTCAVVRKTAFDSHLPCYVNPDKSNQNISICNLDNDQWWEIFWTIKSSLTQSWDSFNEATSGLFETRKMCDSYKSQTFIDDVKQIRFIIIVLYPARSRQSTISLLKLASKYIDYIATRLHWNEKGVLWHSYLSANLTLMDTRLEITTFLTVNNSKSVNFDQVMDDFQDSILVNNFKNKINNIEFQVEYAKGCIDADCLEVSFNVTTMQSEETKETSRLSLVLGVSAAALIFSFATAIVCIQRRKVGTNW